MKKTFVMLFLLSGCGQNLGVGNKTITYNNNNIIVNQYFPQETRDSEESFYQETNQQVLTLVESERSLSLEKETDEEDINEFLEIKESEINFEVVHHEANEEFCRSIREEVEVEEDTIEDEEIVEEDIIEESITCDERFDLAIECVNDIVDSFIGSQATSQTGALIIEEAESCWSDNGFRGMECIGRISGDSLRVSCVGSNSCIFL